MSDIPPLSGGSKLNNSTFGVGKKKSAAPGNNANNNNNRSSSNSANSDGTTVATPCNYRGCECPTRRARDECGLRQAHIIRGFDKVLR